MKDDEHPEFKVTALVSHVDGEALRVAVQLSDPSKGRVVKLMRISLSDDNAFFTGHKFLHLSNALQRLGGHEQEPILYGDLLLIRTDDAIVLWNFVCHACSAISFGDVEIGRPEEVVVLAADMIIAFRRGLLWGEVHVWELPPAAEFKKVTTPSFKVAVAAGSTPPDKVLLMPLPEDEDDRIHSLNVPSGAHTLPLTFDIFSWFWRGIRSHPVPTRVINSCLRCTLNFKRPLEVDAALDAADLLSIDVAGSFKIRVQGTGESLISPQFSPSLSGSNLTFAFIKSRTMERKKGSNHSESRYSTFAYFLQGSSESVGTRRAGRTVASNSSSGTGSSLHTDPASVRVTRFYEPRKSGREMDSWTACPASGRMVSRDCDEADMVLLDFLN
ncbi:hypothetical protein D9611_007791 [Ephemerocybe angulata]|uniref:Uncharacterized protein n=1 Tax=Ephemerocybe angulata TaxID=980116 RepID=A0A8H5FKK9_9AGAR|nr:hypothetical protein D9611_007791 [Tulosesus angulatus]